MRTNYSMIATVIAAALSLTACSDGYNQNSSTSNQPLDDSINGFSESLITSSNTSVELNFWRCSNLDTVSNRTVGLELWRDGTGRIGSSFALWNINSAKELSVQTNDDLLTLSDIVFYSEVTERDAFTATDATGAAIKCNWEGVPRLHLNELMPNDPATSVTELFITGSNLLTAKENWSCTQDNIGSNSTNFSVELWATTKGTIYEEVATWYLDEHFNLVLKTSNNRYQFSNIHFPLTTDGPDRFTTELRSNSVTCEKTNLN